MGQIWVYINGEFLRREEAKVSVFDRGFLYGDSLFETLCAYGGVPFLLDAHIARLEKALKVLKIPLPMPIEALKSAVIETLKRNELQDAYIRITVSRGEGPLGLDIKLCQNPTIAIMALPFKGHAQELYTRGIRLVTVPTVHLCPAFVIGQLKSGNFLISTLAKNEALRAGAYEGVLLDCRGFVVEGSTSNIFMVKDETLITPPLQIGALAGITRGFVMDIAKNLGVKVEEKILTCHDLYTSDELFITNSIIEIMPAVEIDGRQIKDGTPGQLTKMLLDHYRATVRKVCVEV